MNPDTYTEERSSYANTSDFIGELNQAIRQNPIPAALVGVGILWLFTGGRNVMLAGGATYRGVRDVTGRVAGGIQGAAVGAGNAGALAAGAVTGAADSAGSAIGHAVSDAASGLRERVWSHGGDEPSYQTHIDQPVGDGLGNFGQARQTLADLFARQPLMLGAVGIAVGTAIAASLPASEAENRLVGDTAEALKDRAEALWDEAKSRGAELASESLKAAEAQGLTPAAAGAAAREIASKVTGLAERASKDISDRARG